jgi:uncharacterized membrane protein HdeD (DUF308 family)
MDVPHSRGTDVRGRSTGTILAIGIFELLLGIFSITAPYVASRYFTLVLGAVVCASGLLQILGAHGKGSAVKWITGIIALGTGIFVLINPVAGFRFLAVLLFVYFIVSGISRIIFAYQMRVEYSWIEVLTGGMVGIALALLLVVDWPGNTIVALSVFVGINIITAGLLNLFFAPRIGKPVL